MCYIICKSLIFTIILQGRYYACCKEKDIEVWKKVIKQSAIKTARDFILGGSKITADGDCSHEI